MDFKYAKMMLKQIRPKMFDDNFIKAIEILKRLERKSEKNRDILEKRFIYLVDLIFEKEDEDSSFKK